MGLLFFFVGLGLAVLMMVVIVQVKITVVRQLASVAGLIFVILGVLGASIVHIGADEVGIVHKNAFGPRLTDGKIVAAAGEMGIQAEVLPPGWHVGFFPVIYTVNTVPLTEIRNDEVGLVETADGQPLPPGQLFAPEFGQSEFQKMLDARHFLTAGKGYKGKQTSVLTPGKYRLNTEFFRIRSVKQTEVVAGEVAVVKSNFGTSPSQVVRGIHGSLEHAVDGDSADPDKLLHLAKRGEMGILSEPLPPGKYPLNTDAFTVTEIWTTQMIAHFTGSGVSNPQSAEGRQREAQGREQQGRQHDASLEEREITVRTSDGFTFPVDVRIEYTIEPHNAPIVVAKLGDDEGDRFRNALNSAVRAIFRNNAENVRALDYVQMRSHQEEQCFKLLSQQMARFGITVTAVRIGNVGDEKTLGKLLETQTQREIAKQEQVTVQEQQKAAEQKKALSKATQEAEEEKKLATAAYSVKIASETQKQRITEAEGEAQATQIKAKAQADAYRQIAEQIGKSNAALIELLKIVGEKGIQITPRILVTGSGGGSPGGGHDVNAALVGTILDNLTGKDEDTPKPAGAGPAGGGKPKP